MAKAPGKRGLFWGAWIGPQLTGTQPPWDMSAVSHFEQQTGQGPLDDPVRRPLRRLLGTRPARFYDFPDQEMESDPQLRRSPVPQLELAGDAVDHGPAQPDFQLSDVISGTLRRLHPQLRRRRRRHGVTPTSCASTGSRTATGSPGARASTAISQANSSPPGATCTTSSPRSAPPTRPGSGAPTSTSTSSPRSRSFYPGDEYVDWSCLDGYNWAKARSQPAALEELRPDLRLQLPPGGDRRSPRTSRCCSARSPRAAGSRAKARWIRKMFTDLHTRVPPRARPDLVRPGAAGGLLAAGELAAR